MAKVLLKDFKDNFWRENVLTTIQLIQKRVEESSYPKLRKDNYKLGLVIEGGGMRGVIGTAMASALYYLGFRQAFDAVYGSSAGALTGSFFVTGQIPVGPSIYYDNLTCSQFISFRRALFKKGPLMNLDYLIKDVLQGEKPLDYDAFLNSDIPLGIVVSSLNRRKAICYKTFESKEDVFTLLKASATVPIVAGPPVEFKGDRLFDASLYESIPYRSAVADGCTHILVLLTRPKGVLRGKPGLIEKLVAKKVGKYGAGLESDYLARAPRYSHEIKEITGADSVDIEGQRVMVDYIQPYAEGAKASRLARGRDNIIRTSKSAMQSVVSKFMPDKQCCVFETLYPMFCRPR